jgi:L,D-transpeptidase YcbB
MRGLRVDRVLTGTALALLMANMLAGSIVARAQDAAENRKEIEALVPLPDAADVPPPSLGDMVGLPMPEPATVGTIEIPPAEPAPVEPAAATAQPEPSSPAPSQPTTTVSTPPVTEPPAAATAQPEPPSPAPSQPTTTVSTPPVTEPPVAAPAKEPPQPVIAADLSPVDQAIAEKLRELLAGKFDRIFDRRKERTPIEALYSSRGYAPLWIKDGALNERGKATIARLKAADSDGLEPSDYPVPDFKRAADRPDAMAEAELRLVSAVLTYARHAQTGRVHYSRVSTDIVYEQVFPEPAEVLAKLAGASDAGEALGSFNPPHAGYKALRAKLNEPRSPHGETGPARIDQGPVLKPGMQDSRVPLLRRRLGVPADGHDNYDKPLAEVVKKFQRQHDLAPTGNLNSATIDALNGPRRERDADVIIANMERWRWLPRDLGKAHVMVNIPDFTLKVVRDGTTIWHTKIVTGKPTMPTPLLSQPMRFITMNPTWNVPPSIVQNEYLPALSQDPMALERIGLRMEYNRDGTVHIFQPPGEKNALGRVRFNFPNKFLVYQHDTPDKYLFAHDKRAYSHGCMRVENPLKYAEVLLGIARPHDGYTQERLSRMIGTGEQDIQFQNLIPVHLTYQTAFVDESGKLNIREDVYGRDARVIAALKGEERRFADVPVEHPQTAARQQAVRFPQRSYYPFGGGQFPFFGWFR